MTIEEGGQRPHFSPSQKEIWKNPPDFLDPLPKVEKL